jgi:hypothetical protein
MQKTLIFITTHIINKAIISEYKKMSKVKNADCILAVDNTKLKIPFDNRITEKEFYNTTVKCFFFDKEVHDELKLPFFAEHNPTDSFAEVMWYNSDYRFYYVKKYFPGYDYYWQFEYDVFCNGISYQSFFDKYSDRKEDFLTTNFREEYINGEWFWSNTMDWLYKDKKIYGVLFPICRLTANAADFLYKQRLIQKDLYEPIEDKKHTFWPFCELFVPTELINNGYTVYNLEEKQITYDKEYDLNEDRLFENPDNLIYHPVKGMFLEKEKKLKEKNKYLEKENGRLTKENKNLVNENGQLLKKLNSLKKKNKELNKKNKELSVFKVNIMGIKISHKRKV